MATDDRDEMLRALAKHRGFKLVKSRRRKPGTGDYGHYGLTDAESGKQCIGFGNDGLTASAEDIESYLRGQANADWKSSLSAPDDRPAVRKRRSTEVTAEPDPVRAPQAKTPRTRTPVAAAVAPARTVTRLQPRAVPAPPPSPSKPSLVVREAGPKDARGIAALIGAMEAAPPLATIKRTLAVMAQQGTAALVAIEGEVIGCAGYQLISALQHPTSLGRITLLIVDKGTRRRGIGTRLIEEVENRLRKAGCGMVEIVNDIELSNANSFLRGRAYQRSGYRFARDLGK